MVRTTVGVTAPLCCLVLLIGLSAPPAVATDRGGSPPTAGAGHRLSAPLSADERVSGGRRATAADPRQNQNDVDAAEVAGPRTGARPRLSPERAALRDKMRRVLRIYFAKNLNTRDHSPWSIMHATIAFGVDTQVRVGGPRGTPVTSVGWLCFNRDARGQQLFFPSGDRFGIRKGPGVQGHHGQLLAILAQSHVMPDYAIKVGSTDFTVMDLVEYEKQTCVARTELTFKLIGLSHYLDLDATWQSQNGQQWSVPRLIREELAQPIQGATCGGSHRLMALSYAVRKRAARGEPIIGEYRRALVFVRDYHNYTFRLQNRDGSFSTAWFRCRENRPDPARKLTTTGHILEWMAFSLPAEDLEDPRMIRAVHYVNNLLLQGRSSDWKIGSLGHALRALSLYDQRVFGGTTDDYGRLVLGKPPRTAAAKVERRGR